MRFQNMTSSEVIQILRKGRMLSNQGVHLHVQGALSKHDPNVLFDYLIRHPHKLAIAERNIEIINYQQAENPFKPYPSSSVVKKYLSGPLKLGFIDARDSMFGIHPDVLCLLMIVLGRVGSGKSQFILNLIVQILNTMRSFNIVIPDLKGKEYRNLLPITKNLKIITREKFQLNPLQVPEWINPQKYAMLFAKIFVRENYLMATSESILFEILVSLYRKRGIFEGSRNCPTLRDLYKMINFMLNNEKSFRYRDVLLGIKNRLVPYIYSDGFKNQTGIPEEVWRNENVVLEMGAGFTDNMYSFIISFITGLRYNYNFENGLVGSKLRTLIVVDEGRLLFRQRDQTMFGESYISEVSTRLRDPGIGLLIASQESSSFNSTIKAISHTKICFPITDGIDVSFVKESFGLNDEQAEFLFKLPSYGQAIVRYGGYEEPFLLAVPEVKINQIMSDEDVNFQMSDFYNELDKKNQNSKPAPSMAKINQSMPASAATLIYYLGKNPFTKVSGMTKSGIKSPAEVSRAISWLEQNAYVLRHAIRVSKRGRKSVFYELTPKAYKHLKMKAPKGKGSFLHRLYQYKILKYCQMKGWNAQIEGKLGVSRKVIDVLARNEFNQSIGYEVTIHFENLISNIKHDIKSGISNVVIVTTDRAASNKAKKIVEGNPSIDQDQISFSVISDFFA